MHPPERPSLLLTLAMRLLSLTLLLAIGSCGAAQHPELTSEERAWGASALAQWRAAGLPEPSGCRADLLDFQVLRATEQEYVELCRGGPDASSGCLHWGAGEGMLSGEVPVVVVSPRWHVEYAIVIHEILHALVRCSGLGEASGISQGDHDHTLPVVWTHSGSKRSVEWRAREPFQ